jgi:Uri superfamily endonuclease
MSLERRLARHRRHEKARKWHVDYITTRSQCQLRGAVYVVGKRALECKINRLLCMAIGTQLILPHLGSSDCTCKAHLVGIERSISRRELVRQLEYAYSTFGTPRFYGVN